VALAIVLVLCAVFPPIRIRRYRPGQTAVTSSGGTPALRPADAAQRLWDERLMPAAAKAADAKAVVAALRADSDAARKRYARTVDLGGPGYFFIAGTGRVVSKGKHDVALRLDGAGPPNAKPDIVIDTGPLFGNAVRDGTGWVSPSDYPNSEDYNALSAELNNLVKTRVFPTLRDRAQVGARVRFAGVAELAPDETHPLPLQVVPVLVEVQ
jgi:predicted lipoprotein